MICCNIFTSYIISSFCFDIIFCAIQMGFAFNQHIMWMFIVTFFNGCFRCSLLIKCFHTLTVCCKKISWLSTMKIKIFLTIRRILIVTQWVTSILQTTMKTLLEVIDFGGLSMSDFFIKFFGWCIFIFKKCIHLYWNKDTFHMHYLLSSMGFFSLI